MAQAAPGLTEAALESINAELEALPHTDSISLACRIEISFFSAAVEKISGKLGLDPEELLKSIGTDLGQGLSVKMTEWKTREGISKVLLIGSKWRVVIHPRPGRKSGLTLTVLDGVSEQKIPSQQAMFRPGAVQVHDIRKEVGCDPAAICAEYEAGMRAYRKILGDRGRLQQHFRQVQDDRRAAISQANKELQRAGHDPSLSSRRRLHGTVRKQYSALRVMMDMLKLRSVHESLILAGKVLAPPGQEAPHSAAGLAQSEATSDLSGSLRILLPKLPGDSGVNINEGAQIKLRSDESPRLQRGSVVGVTVEKRNIVLDVDLFAHGFEPGEEVQVEVLSRFNMWAHQKAVQSLLDENVHGHWPDLAKLVCNPDQLVVPGTPPSAAPYFCDVDPNRHSLNAKQRAAVDGAVSSPHMFCIQGPPGTGKTTVICEVIQQLISRGERVLLTASTHPAVDAALRKIGSCEGIRALRLSWDEQKIAEDNRQYAPSQIVDPFVKRAASRDSSLAAHWLQEEELSGEAAQLLHQYQASRRRSEEEHARKDDGEQAMQSACSDLDSNEPSLEQEIQECGGRIQTGREAIHIRRSEAQKTNESLETATRNAGVGGRLLGWMGTGEVGRKRRAAAESRDRLDSRVREVESLRRKRKAAMARLARLRTKAGSAVDVAAKARESLSQAVSAEGEAADACRRHPLLKKKDLSSDSVEAILLELQSRGSRLGVYQKLDQRFDELAAEATKAGKDPDGIRRDLLAVANLFCCTTTGIAGCKELKDVAFDTLIIDEASRVGDSEFLIGAVRAKRWILVGDEHQLPPYVDQNDEHFIHAMSALHQVEAKGVELEDSVAELASLWKEDEELHQFRKESVEAIASNLHGRGLWQTVYRSAFGVRVKSLSREAEDPSRTLLHSMRKHLVHSLFERIVASGPEALRVRLVEQRRMIAPIAEIVSAPIYDGDYENPPDEELARCGIVPLMTPTFDTPITFLDTSSLGIRAKNELQRSSFVNRTEARWIVEACQILDRELGEFPQQGSEPVTVSILTFYKAQARLIQKDLGLQAARNRYSRLKFSVIDSIDRIQGQESDVVFISFCRTAGPTVGPFFGQWLQDLRRLNVACTRARRALFFVGQRDLLTRLRSNEKAMEFYRHLDYLFKSRPGVMRVIQQFGSSRQ